MVMPTDPDPGADYVYHRNHFAEQILISAALYADRTKPGGVIHLAVNAMSV